MKVIPGGGTKGARAIKTRSFADIEPKPISWLWRGWIPAHGLTLVEGYSGCGKSTVLTDLAARATTGAPWPGEASPRDPLRVLWIQAEEEEAEVLIPRIIAAGADRAAIVGHVTDDPWRASEADRLRATIEEEGIGLVILDPLKAYQGGVDDNSETDVRSEIQPLANLGVPVLGVRHWTKGRRSAAERGGGSQAYRGVARATLVVAPDPDGENRILALDKTSLAASSPAWEFTIEPGREVVGESRPIVRWVCQRDDVTADDLAMAEPRPRGAGSTKTEEAKQAILESLRRHGGEAGLARVIEDAKPVASKRTAETALRALRDEGTIETERQGFGGTAIVKLARARAYTRA